ncbi:MAG TPA: hypothetical protein VH309_08820 [Elusimicrobiota bacterium]|jgi:hypothetical protein|nr:hypothetical protein [Elusimicrobiota bacterium]
MHWRSPARGWYALILAGFAASSWLGGRADERMVVRPVGGQRLAGQSSGAGEDGGPSTTQKILRTADGRRAEYGFQDFTGDKLDVAFEIAEKDFAAYNDSFGYTQEGLDALKTWRAKARRDALDAAVKRGDSQARLDAAVALVDKEYKAKQKDYLAERGFALEPGGVVVVDMPALVRRNAPLIKPLALDFARIAASRRYGSSDIVGAVLSMVQTAMFYKEPDSVIDGKHNGGLLPPLTSVAFGWGDCDTKTGVLASILANWPESKMVGVSVPGHFLMGILQIPAKGDTILEYRGLQYVLVEPAGPAWLPPGRVGEQTSILLAARDGYTIEPFF